jgi:putative transposase
MGWMGGKNEKVPVAMLKSGSRRPPLPKLRRAIALKLINEYGVSLAETARHLAYRHPVWRRY